MEAFDLNQWGGFCRTNEPFIIDDICIDSRQVSSRQSLFVALKGSKEDGHQYVEDAYQKGAIAAIVSKDFVPNFSFVNFTLIHVLDPINALQEIAEAYRLQFNVKVIAIVGSHGKTMVKNLLHRIISTEKNVVSSPGSYNSQIGVPLSLLNINHTTEVALIECAVSKKNEMDRLIDIIHPRSCIVTHLGKKHLATIGSLEAFSHEILKMAVRPKNLDFVILPQNDSTLPLLSQINCPTYFWNRSVDDLPHIETKDNNFYSTLKYRLEFPKAEAIEITATSGFFYFKDLLNITSKSASLVGISDSSISKTIENYTLEPTRVEICKTNVGTTLINESYSTNVQSILASLNHFKLEEGFKRKIFVFGGSKKQSYESSEISRIVESILQVDVNVLFLVGSIDYSKIKEHLLKQAPYIKIQHEISFENAFQKLSSTATSEDVIVICSHKKQSLNSILEIFNDSISMNQCFINLAAIDANLCMIKQKLKKDTRLMVMVKAFAYGTDDVRMAKFLSTCNVDILGVSYVDEAITLKRANITQSLFVINATPYEAKKIVKWDLEIGVSEIELILAIERHAKQYNKKIKLHLHVDTGMSRLGCRKEDALKLAQYIATSDHLILEGLMTHFACSDSVYDDSFTLSQAKIFDDIAAELKNNGIHPKWIHASNSSAIIRFDFPQYNMVRVGLAAYGLYASDDAKNKMDLRLGISLVSRIVGINTCHKGETVSYGRSYKVEKDNQKIAVLPIGYYDGIHRNYSGKAHVLIRGQKAPMVGKICMDYMMVDISDIKDASIGDPVLIFGEDEFGQYLPPENLASQGNSIVHELITCLGPRIQRIFIHEESNNQR